MLHRLLPPPPHLPVQARPHLSESLTWRLSSAAAASVFSVVLLTQFRRHRAIEAGQFPPWVVIVYAISLVTVAALWLNAAGTPLPRSVGPYAVALTWTLCVFGFIFVRAIDIFLHRPRT